MSFPNLLLLLQPRHCFVMLRQASIWNFLSSTVLWLLLFLFRLLWSALLLYVFLDALRACLAFLLRFTQFSFTIVFFFLTFFLYTYKYIYFCCCCYLLIAVTVVIFVVGLVYHWVFSGCTMWFKSRCNMSMFFLEEILINL